MTVTGRYLARKIFIKNTHYVMIKIAESKQIELIDKLFEKKTQYDKKHNIESLMTISLILPKKSKTYKQLRTIFALVTAIFVSMEGRLPTEDEKYDLYLDLLEVYGMKIPSKLNPNALRPIHMSESNVFEAANFINGLMLHLATACDLDYDLQSTVQSLLWDWSYWRGAIELDPLDYYDSEYKKPIAESDWRERHKYSEASGRIDNIHLHHIVTRGSNHAAIDKVWNWCALTFDEHQELHQYGEKKFLEKYKHLTGKFTRAKKLARQI